MRSHIGITSNILLRVSLLASASLVAMTMKLSAQSPTTPGTSGSIGASAQGSGAGKPPALSEITVTAQRRSERLQKAAVSVDAISGRELVRNNITDAATLGTVVPGLTVQAAGGGLVDYFIRGVGNFTETPIADAAVAYNIDSVYIGRPIATSGPFFDLDRVEVLKGPQGNLYGRNATAGAINVIPTRPVLDTLTGYLTADYGNYNTYGVEGAINGPISENTALRLSFTSLGHDGYLNDGTSDQDTQALRLQILSNLTDNLSVRLVFDYSQISGVGGGSNYVDTWHYDPAAGKFIIRNSGLGASDGLYSAQSQAFLESLMVSPAGRDAAALSPYPFQDNKLWGLHAEINYDTSFGRLTVIPSWRPTSVDTASGVPGFTYQLNEADNDYSTEVRFAGNRIGIFDYTVGGLFFREIQKSLFATDLQAEEAYQNLSQATDSYAGFGRITAHVTDQLRLVGGLRYSSDNLGFDGSGNALTSVCLAPSCPNGVVFPFTTSLATQSIPYPAPGGVKLIPPATLILNDRETQDSRLTNDRTTYRGAIEYDVLPHSLAYASIETGYREGGFNLAKGYETYQPEYITAYTLGSKNRFLDDSLELNGELFLWKYTNQQVSHLALDSSGDLSNITQNIGRSTNEGYELEMRYLLRKDTVLTANIQYLDAEYNSYIYDLPAIGGVPYTGCAVSEPPGKSVYAVNCSGKPSYNAPRYTIDLGAQRTFHLRGYTVIGNVNTQYLGARYIGFSYQAAEMAPAVWHTNAELTLTPEIGKWAISVFIQNIEDNRYPTSAIENPIANSLVTTTAPPRVYGARLTLRF